MNKTLNTFCLLYHAALGCAISEYSKANAVAGAKSPRRGRAIAMRKCFRQCKYQASMQILSSHAGQLDNRNLFGARVGNNNHSGLIQPVPSPLAPAMSMS